MAKPKKKVKKQKELTDKQLQTLVTDLQQFEEGFYLYIAGTDRFEIVPTVSESGRVATKEQLTLIKEECLRLGIKPLYRIDNDKAILVVNPENLKIGYLVDGSVN